MELLSITLALGLGYFVGSDLKKLQDRLTALENKKKPEVGATPGAYSQPNDYNFNQPGKTGLVLPKTPEMLAWEDEERQREAQRKVVVKPRE